jgi:hypothetical protein
MAVVRANYVKPGSTERQGAKANIAYIQTRPGKGKERLSRTLFGTDGNMGRKEAYQFINDAAPGTYFYRLKVSPDPATEDVKRDLKMQKLTRSLMRRLEKRLTTNLPWAAAVHDDHTDIRHVHILAAIPRRLQTYELEFLIREATHLSRTQRRFLERGEGKLPWQKKTSSRPLKIGTYTTYRNPKPASSSQGQGTSNRPHSCTCFRCHMAQSHDVQGSHQCIACGIQLHKKKELKLQRERGLERSI